MLTENQKATKYGKICKNHTTYHHAGGSKSVKARLCTTPTLEWSGNGTIMEIVKTSSSICWWLGLRGVTDGVKKRMSFLELEISSSETT